MMVTPVSEINLSVYSGKAETSVDVHFSSQLPFYPGWR